MTKEEKQKAIDALKISAPIMAVTQEEFNDYIQTLNKIMDWLEQEPRWIPVSERLPEEQGWYLVTIKSGDKYYRDMDLYNTLYVKGFRTPNVIAWMPLPKPYKTKVRIKDE